MKHERFFFVSFWTKSNILLLAVIPSVLLMFLLLLFTSSAHFSCIYVMCKQRPCHIYTNLRVTFFRCMYVNKWTKLIKNWIYAVAALWNFGEKKVFKSMFGSFLFIVFSIKSYGNVSWPVAASHVLIIISNELSLFSGSYLVMRCAIIYSLNYDGRFFFYLVLIFWNFYFVLDRSFFSLF